MPDADDVNGGGQALQAFGVGDRAGHDAVHAHALGAPFQRQHLGEHVHAGLGGAHMGLVGRGREGLRGRDLDHAGPGLAQVLVGQPRHVEAAQQVDVDHGLEGPRRQPGHRCQEVACRARHQHVDGPETLGGGLQCRGHGLGSRTSALWLPASGPRVLSRSTAAATLSAERLMTDSRAPALAKASAMPRLMPLVPPATKTWRPLKSKRGAMVIQV
jgi:hypothetical protein